MRVGVRIRVRGDRNVGYSILDHVFDLAQVHQQDGKHEASIDLLEQANPDPNPNLNSNPKNSIPNPKP